MGLFGGCHRTHLSIPFPKVTAPLSVNWLVEVGGWAWFVKIARFRPWTNSADRCPVCQGWYLMWCDQQHFWVPLRHHSLLGWSPILQRWSQWNLESSQETHRQGESQPLLQLSFQPRLCMLLACFTHRHSITKEEKSSSGWGPGHDPVDQ